MSLRFSGKADLKCKHCGFKKSKLDLYCFFQWDDARWSDNREVAPSQAIPGPVQFCPNCRHFYYIDAAAVLIDDVDDYNWIEPLSYEKILSKGWCFCGHSMINVMGRQQRNSHQRQILQFIDGTYFI